MPKVLDNGTFRVYVYANDDNRTTAPTATFNGTEMTTLAWSACPTWR